MEFDVAVIGAGVIGGMLSRELSKYKLSVCLLEKGNDVAVGASKANSGIIHGGYDPEPGTLKARLNSSGVEKLFKAARELNVPCKRNGSMVCAFGAEEEAAVDALYERGLENGMTDLEIISGDTARRLEPELSDKVTKALLVKNSGIVCPYELTIAAVGNAMDNGAVLKRSFEVCEIGKASELFTLKSTDGECVKAKFVVNCSGAYSDKTAALTGDDFFKIIPRSGEYLLLDKSEGKRVGHTIFQVPSKDGKGILVSPTVDGNLLTGPTAETVTSPSATETTIDGMSNVMKFAAKSVPSVNFRNVITSFAGVRASESGGDFIIKPSEKFPELIHVAAIDSPGLTCCVSIAEYTVELLKKVGLNTEKRNDFNPNRINTHAFREMNDTEKNVYIKAHPEYGHIICRCETVSEGEIRDAVRRNPSALDIDGVKRRTRSGMGRCQGGFCMPYVMKIISEELEIPLDKVTKKGKSSETVIGEI